MYIQEAENARYTFQHTFQIHLYYYTPMYKLMYKQEKKIDT